MLVRSFVKWGWAPLWWARGGLQLMWSQAAVSLGRRHKMALARNSARPQDNDTEIIRTSSPAPSHHNNIGYWWDSAAVMINSRRHDDVLFSCWMAIFPQWKSASHYVAHGSAHFSFSSQRLEDTEKCLPGAGVEAGQGPSTAPSQSSRGGNGECYRQKF